MTYPQLSRYSKPRGPGDQTSGGRGKLLRATSALSRIQILVRETLQNSWDARDDDWYPAYGARVYPINEYVRHTLSNHVFCDLPPSLNELSLSLTAPGVHALEIFDRGTSGLDGPIHAAAEAPEGTSNNFNAFVFDIGTTKPSAVAGGTYGFGKTATFEVSQAHSVVYWSRCQNSYGDLEYRLIASSLHDPYSENGARFTGAHWWGDPSQADDIVPLVGDDAKGLGEALFRTHFGDDETGTSILIIDPVISVPSKDDSTAQVRTPVRSSEHASQLVQQISNALAKNAWPKVIPMEHNESPMKLELYVDGVDQDIASGIRERYERFADALINIRIEQQQQDAGTHEPPPLVIRHETYPISLRPRGALAKAKSELYGGRTDNIVGHLHLVESVADPIEDQPFQLRNVVCLMRSNAELVVRYDSIVEPSDDIIQWHGVFKPTPECDHHFAACEPPTHDGWVAESAESEISTYVVSKALGQIRRRVRQFLADGSAPIVEGTRSVRGVSNELRGFVPFGNTDQDNGYEPKAGSRRSAKATKAKAESATLGVVRTKPLPNGGGQILTLMPICKSSKSLMATVSIYAVAADGKLALDDADIDIIWAPNDSTISKGPTCKLAANVRTELTLRTRVASALEIDLSAEALS